MVLHLDKFIFALFFLICGGMFAWICRRASGLTTHHKYFGSYYFEYTKIIVLGPFWNRTRQLLILSSLKCNLWLLGNISGLTQNRARNLKSVFHRTPIFDKLFKFCKKKTAIYIIKSIDVRDLAGSKFRCNKKTGDFKQSYFDSLLKFICILVISRAEFKFRGWNRDRIKTVIWYLKSATLKWPILIVIFILLFQG